MGKKFLAISLILLMGVDNHAVFAATDVYGNVDHDAKSEAPAAAAKPAASASNERLPLVEVSVDAGADHGMDSPLRFRSSPASPIASRYGSQDRHSIT